MAPENQKPTKITDQKLSESDLPPEQDLPAGTFPYPYGEDYDFDPTGSRGDLWLYKESFVDGYPDSRKLLGILQKEKHGKLHAHGEGMPDNTKMMRVVGRSIEDYGQEKSPTDFH